MAIWEIPEDKVIDYSPNGDDVDSFSQKVKYCLEEIFNSLQYLHSNGAATGLPETETNPYEIRINTTDNGIYMRNGANDGWILLGYVDTYCGITPEKIHAVRNGGGVQKLQLGLEGNRPTTGNETNDLYFARDTNRIFLWDGYNWITFLSLHFDETLDFEASCVSRDELTTTGGISGADKILVLNHNGEANVDITGSPARLCNKEIHVENLRDGHTLIYNSEKDKFVNLPNYNLSVAVNNPTDGQALVYRSAVKAFRNENVSTGSGTGGGAMATLTITQGANHTVATYDGTTPETVNFPVRNAPLKIFQGVSLAAAYDGTDETSVTLTGANKALTITQGNSTLGIYDGSTPTAIAIPTVQAASANKTLTLTQGTASVVYDGSVAKMVTLPSANKTLTLTRGTTNVTYNGSAAGRLNLDNETLTIKQGNSVLGTYNGIEAETITIPDNQPLTFSKGGADILTYSGATSRMVDLTPVVFPNLPELNHLKRIILTQLCKDNEEVNGYISGDGVFAEFFDTSKTAGAYTMIDKTLSTWELRESGYTGYVASDSGQFVTQWLSTTRTFKRIYMILGAESHFGNHLTVELGLRLSGKYFNGTDWSTTTETYIPFPLVNTMSPCIKLQSNGYIWTYYYEMPDDAGGNPNHVSIRITSDVTSESLKTNSSEFTPTIHALGFIADGGNMW